MQRTAKAIETHGQNVGQRPDPFSTRAIIAADRSIYRFARRWAPWFNAALLLWVAAFVMAPILVLLGYSGLAQPIYSVFSYVCYQDDRRSFHFSGQKFACCERCTAIYMSSAIAGLLFMTARAWIRPARYHELVLLSTPVLIDGMAVGAGIYDGNTVMRLLTGSLFGIAMVWALYPRFETGFESIRLRLETLFDRLAAQGRARPLG